MFQKKQIKALKDWSDAHPDWSSSEKLTDEYMKIVREATSEMDGRENKIIKTVSKDIMVEKDENLLIGDEGEIKI